MQPQLYEQLAEVEDRHWWHRSRLRLAESYIEGMSLPQAPRILDVGCGTGGTTRFLERFGDVTGIDRCAQALSHARGKVRSARLIEGDANRLDEFVEAQSVDLVTFMGVIYHQWIEDEQALLSRVHRVLRPGGYVLVSEPAWRMLMRHHDVVDLGRTRYRLEDFRRFFEGAGLIYQGGRYFNAAAFPVCLLLALKHRLRRRAVRHDTAPAEVALPPALINRALLDYMRVEQRLLDWVPYPYGVTLMAVGRKEGEA